MKKPEFIKDVEPDYAYWKDEVKKISMGLYKCECGQTFVCRKTKIKHNKVQSCGCLRYKNTGKKIKE